MEFEITTNLDTIRNQTITANFDAVAAWLDKELQPYIGLVVTADAIPSAKNYRANLRKVKDRIEEYRREAKRAALAPYNAFEEQAKVLTGKIDNAVANIDGQVKAFEQREAEEKIAEVRAVYDADSRAEAKEYRPWETIFNPKWANKGYKIEDAQEEVRAALFYTENDLASIRQMGGENTPYLLGIYKDNHDLNVCIRKSLEISAAKEREEQRKREEEERKARIASEPKPEPEPMRLRETAEKIDLVTVDFRVTCTRTALNALGQYMKRNGIKYGRCE